MNRGHKHHLSLPGAGLHAQIPPSRVWTLICRLMQVQPRRHSWGFVLAGQSGSAPPSDCLRLAPRALASLTNRRALCFFLDLEGIAALVWIAKAVFAGTAVTHSLHAREGANLGLDASDAASGAERSRSILWQLASSTSGLIHFSGYQGLAAPEI